MCLKTQAQLAAAQRNAQAAAEQPADARAAASAAEARAAERRLATVQASPSSPSVIMTLLTSCHL